MTDKTATAIARTVLSILAAEDNGRRAKERLAQLLETAGAEGRELTLAELRGLAEETDASLDALEAELEAAAKG